MKLLFWILTALFCLSNSAYAGVAKVTLDDGSSEREYYIYRPGNTSAGSPVLVALHDFGGSARTLAYQSNLVRYADAYQFVLILPNVLDERWIDMENNNARISNDVQFINRILDSIVENYKISPDKVYVAGIGAGGFMAQTYACEGRYHVKGMAIAGAALYKDLPAVCKQPPLDVIYALGDKDSVIDERGGTYKSFSYLSIQDSMSYWIGVDGCKQRATEKVPTLTPGDTTYAVRSTYYGCKDNTVVDFFSIINAGNAWPGSLEKQGSDGIPATRAINFSDMIGKMIYRKRSE